MGVPITRIGLWHFGVHIGALAMHLCLVALPKASTNQHPSSSSIESWHVFWAPKLLNSGGQEKFTPFIQQDGKTPNKNARYDYTVTTGSCFLKDGRQDFSTAEEIILLGAWVLALLGLFVWRFRLHAECLWSSVEDEGGEATAALL